jgi:hypothetical protein
MEQDHLVAAIAVWLLYIDGVSGQVIGLIDRLSR